MICLTRHASKKTRRVNDQHAARAKQLLRAGRLYWYVFDGVSPSVPEAEHTPTQTMPMTLGAPATETPDGLRAKNPGHDASNHKIPQ
jgi:hypothetical protein